MIRRVALSLLIVFVFAYNFRAGAVTAAIGTTLFLIGVALKIIDLKPLVDSFLFITDRVFSGVFTRGMTWERSLYYLSDMNTFLFGNGRNNNSHNYVMHTLTTHGLFYSLVVFSFTFHVIAKLFRATKYSAPIFFVVCSFILVDWNLNTNLYQAYYAGMFALMVVAVSKSPRSSR